MLLMRLLPFVAPPVVPANKRVDNIVFPLVPNIPFLSKSQRAIVRPSYISHRLYLTEKKVNSFCSCVCNEDTRSVILLTTISLAKF